MAPKNIRSVLGVQEVTDNRNDLGKSLIAEAIGVFFINYFGCLGCSTADRVALSFSFGLTVFVLVQTLAHISGAHFNPAITAGMLVTGKTPVIRGILYIICQCLGAIAGTAVLQLLLPDRLLEKNVGLTKLAEGVTPWQGLGLEAFLGFILVFVVFGVTDPNKQFAKITAPLAIGIAVAIGHFSTVDLTGAGMNPARSLGVSVVTGQWMDHWVYWAGPLVGGIVAALLYKYLLSAPQVGDYTPVNIEDKEMKRLDGKNEDTLP